MKKLQFLLFVLICHTVGAQNIAPVHSCKTPGNSSIATLHGDYGGDASKKFYIGVYRESGFQLVDSVFISQKGTLTVPLRNEWRGVIIVACGDYEPLWRETFRNANPETSLQFVFDGQDIEYKTSWRHQSYPSYLKYGKGCEATVALKELNKRFNALQERMYYIEKLMEKTPEQGASNLDTYNSGAFNAPLRVEFAYSVGNFNAFCDSVSNNFKGQTFMQLYCQMFKQVVPPNNIQFQQRPAWRAEHLFDYCDLKNPVTVNIPLFKDKIRQYLYLNMPVGVASTDAIEQSQKDALERLQAKCSFTLPTLLSEEQQLRQQILATNMEEFYGSPGYHDTVNSWLPLYNPGSGRFQGMFAEDMLTLLDNIHDHAPEAFTGFANDLLSICTQLGWDNDGTIIAEYLYQNQSRLKKPTGIIKKSIEYGRLQPGQPAPNLVGAEYFLPKNETGTRAQNIAPQQAPQRRLIIFYESGCNNCENEMRQLIGNYSILQERGYDVISISADNDQTVYECHSRDFPWPEKLCDFKGFEGENFKNYGVIGTPTIYVIDEKGIIKGKYARLVDTEVLN